MPFLSRWHTQPLSDLAGKIRHTMPAGATGTLTPQQSADLVALILKVGKLPAEQDRPGLLTRSLEPHHVAGWTRRRGGLPAARPEVYPPLGNMAQLMRGIFFPNSNLIFTVQTRDPAAPAAADDQRIRPPASRSWTGAPGFTVGGSSWTTPRSHWPMRRR